MNRSALLVSLLSLGFVGCMTDSSALDDNSSAVQLPPADAQHVLDLVNYPGTDAALLDGAVGLDSRAAKNIITKRDGADNTAPSADDHLFASIADLDTVSFVSSSALTKLATYASAHPAPTGETVETVAFAGWESQAVVFGVNNAAATDLDKLIDARAVKSLVAARPFTSVTAMGPLSYVGVTALTKLHAQAPLYWAAMRGASSLAGTFDTVTFDEADAATALDISNNATTTELTGHGVQSTAAGKIIAGRPFTTLAEVSSVSGVGTSTMKALLAFAQSGQWGAGATCVASFNDVMAPQLPHLLFLSESDRPLDVVSFPGAGGTVPTAASIFALLGHPPGWTFEIRSPDDYFNDLENNDAGGDAAQAAVRAAYAAQLTDLVYVAVHQPPDSIDNSLVDVYLIGRTACGDLVGIHAISVET